PSSVRRRNTVYLAQQKNFSRKNGSIHKKNIFTTEGVTKRDFYKYLLRPSIDQGIAVRVNDTISESECSNIV
ncbi:hypothetical protein L9F63_008161, partial [Diploptera punctata]